MNHTVSYYTVDILRTGARLKSGVPQWVVPQTGPPKLDQ